MKTRKIWAILVFVLVSTANGAQYLTIDGNAVDSITLEVGQVCTVEVASTDNSSYADNVGFDDALVLGTFSHVQTKAAAGSLAGAIEYSQPEFYGYYVMAGGLSPRPSPGVHFVFEYEAEEIGETELKLYNELFTLVVDSVHIKVIPAPMGTTFTYQGHLIDSNKPADGLYDLQFSLYNTAVGGTPKGRAISMNEVDVNDGVFTLNLDFGGDVFDGNALWLEIGVRAGELSEPNAYTLLSPRQRVMPVPYAIYAQRAGSLERGVGWSEISDRPAGLDNGDDVGITGETDPTVLASVKDGVTWGEISNRPPGLDDGDQIGITTEADPTVNLAKLKSLVSSDFHNLGGSEFDPVYSGSSASGITSGSITNWNTAFGWGNHALPGYLRTETDPTVTLAKLKSLVSNDFHNLGGTDQVGITSESDPQVGSITTNYIPKWNGSALVSGTVYDNGNIGIGTTSPVYKLDVVGYIRGVGFYDADDTNYYINPTGSTSATLQGNVGIGTTTPGAKLEVNGQVKITGGSPGAGKVLTSDAAGLASWQTPSGGPDNLGNHTATQNIKLNGYWLSGDGGNEGIYVTSSGNVGVGTTSPTAAKLTVQGASMEAIYAGTTGSNASAVVGVSEGAGGTGVEGWGNAGDGVGVLGRATNSGNVENYGGVFMAMGTHGRGVRGYAIGDGGQGVRGEAWNGNGIGVYGSGNKSDFYAVHGTYHSESSIRWKGDIRPIDSPLDKVMNLRGVYFNWDAEHGGQHDVGMVAEEVGKVLPEIVAYEQNGIDATGMDYSKLTPLLVEAVKALKAEVDTQQKKITALEAALAQNESMKQRIDILEAKMQALQSPVAKEVRQ